MHLKKPKYGKNLDVYLPVNLNLKCDVVINWAVIKHCRATMVCESKIKITHTKSSSESLQVECHINNRQKNKVSCSLE